MRMTFALVAVLLFVASCATAPYQPYAREVKKKPNVNGVIALKTEHVPADRTYADQIMAKNCGTNPVNVTEEGEVEVGKTTSSNSKQTDEKEEKFKWGGMNFVNPAEKNTAKTATTVSIKEWQIAYDCGSIATNTTAPKSTKKK